MKKLFSFLICSIAIVALLASCSDASVSEDLVYSEDSDDAGDTGDTGDTEGTEDPDDPGYTVVGSAISFMATLSSSTESTPDVSTKATDIAFESGDEISVTAYYANDSLYGGNVKYSFSGSMFESDSAFESVEGDAFSFLAVYPYMTIDTNSKSVEFTVKEDQSVGENYTNSDMMVSRIASTSETTPSLSFSRLMVDVVININGSGTLDCNPTLIGVETGVKYNFATETTTLLSNQSDVVMASEGSTYKAIIAPQAIAKEAIFATISISGVEHEVAFVTDITLVGGYRYTLNATIDESGTITFDEPIIKDWDSALLPNAEYLTLSDFSTMTTAADLPEFNTWVIEDLTASSNNNYTSLCNALLLADNAGRTIDVTFPYLTELPSYAFDECIYLKSITLSKATTIGNYAFTSCTALNSVDLPAVTTVNLRAFSGCIALTSIELPSVTSLGNYGFYGCTNLNSVNLQKAITVGSYAFENCTYLTDISLPMATSVGEAAFKSCVELESIEMPKLIDLGGYAFDGCINLKSVEFVNATTIGNYAFSSCTALNSVDLPAVTTVNLRAFSGCIALTSIELPSVTSLGNYGFYGCTNLNSVNLQKAITVGSYAFENCTYLTDISLPMATSVGEAAFKSCVELESIEMPKLIDLGGYAFDGCINLKSVEFVNATTIGNYAFSSCTSLTSIDLPEAEYINMRAFSGCTYLSYIGLQKVHSIGNYAFASCVSLSSMKLASSSYMTSLSSNAFDGVTTANIAVTTSSLNTVDDKTLTVGGTSVTFASIAIEPQE